MSPRFGTDAKSFARTLRRHAAMAMEREELLYQRSFDHATRSVLDGSEVTGAPGQPFRTGNLYRAFHVTGSLASQNAALVADLEQAPYAPIVEDNLHGARYHNGGPHSIKITRVNFRHIVRHELARVKKEVKM